VEVEKQKQKEMEQAAAPGQIICLSDSDKESNCPSSAPANPNAEPTAEMVSPVLNLPSQYPLFHLRLETDRVSFRIRMGTSSPSPTLSRRNSLVKAYGISPRTNSSQAKRLKPRCLQSRCLQVTCPQATCLKPTCLQASVSSTAPGMCLPIHAQTRC
jgi:hypothetical protein